MKVEFKGTRDQPRRTNSNKQSRMQDSRNVVPSRRWKVVGLRVARTSRIEEGNSVRAICATNIEDETES